MDAAAPDRLTLYTCEIDDGGAKVHPCRRAHDALDTAGIDYDTMIADRNRPLGLFAKGKRPELLAATGPEKLPVLVVPRGEIVAGSGKIVAWAKDQASA